jgi:acyl-CoA synthetase (AMP-forming)/AMP-acid ligase II
MSLAHDPTGSFAVATREPWVRPLAEIVRPFGITDTGLTLAATGFRLSYHELAVRVAAAAGRLHRAGVRPGAAVAMTIANDLPSIVSALGVWAAGCTLVSTPPRPGHLAESHAQRLAAVLSVIPCETVLTDAATPELSAMRSLDKAELAEPGPASSIEAGPPDIALIQFTSGSVGLPKGVAIAGWRLVGHVDAIRQALDYERHRDRFYSWLPLYHDMGLVGFLLTALAGRIELTLAEPRTFALRPSSWLEGVAATRATVTGAPNFAYRLAAQVPYDGLDLSSVRISLSGAERVHWQSLVDFHRAAQPWGLRWEALKPCYGSAENTLGITTTPAGRALVLGPDQHVSVGYPLAGVEVRVVGDGTEPGTIEIGGAWLFDGYYAADGFTPTGPGWFDTGDEGFSRDGELYVLGRRAEVVSAAGRNVFAEDVELTALLVGGTQVRGAAAFRFGPEQDRFGLLVELAPRTRPTEAEEFGRAIKEAVRLSYGVRISPVILSKPGTIRRTTSGKVQRRLSREAYESGQLDRKLVAEVP